MLKLLQIFSFVLFLWSPIAAYKVTKPSELHQVDRQIFHLRAQKRGYEARALRHEALANRLQFQSSQLLKARQHWAIAEKNRAIAKKIQQEIDRLEKRKQQLLN